MNGCGVWHRQNLAASVIRLVAVVGVVAALAGRHYAFAESIAVTDVPHAQDAVLVSIPANSDAGEVLSSLRDEGLPSVDVDGSELLEDGVLSVPLTDGASVEQALAELGSSDAVDTAQPDYLYKVMNEGQPSLTDIIFAATNASVLANDPLFHNQWGLQSINAPAAWSLMLERGACEGGGVVVMDAGFAVEHEDLAGSIPDGAPTTPITPRGVGRGTCSATWLLARRRPRTARTSPASSPLRATTGAA